MSLPEIVFVALSLSLDAAIVAVSAGATGRATPGKALLIVLVFGGFQALMPLLGWGAGSLAKDYLLAYGRVIGFALIFLVGAKMLITFFHIHVHIGISLAVVGGVLLVSVLASLLFPKHEEELEAPRTAENGSRMEMPVDAPPPESAEERK